MFARIHSSILGRIKRLFKPHDKIKVTARTFSQFGFDMVNNMSDHKPISGNVTVVEEKSFFDRFKERVGINKVKATNAETLIRSIEKKTATIEFNEAGELTKADILDWSKIGIKEFYAIIGALHQTIEKSCQEKDELLRAEKIDIALAVLDEFLISLSQFTKPVKQANVFKKGAETMILRLKGDHANVLKNHSIKEFKRIGYNAGVHISSNAISLKLSETLPNAIAYLNHSITTYLQEKK